MAKFIKLTTCDKKPVWLNVDHIDTIHGRANHAPADAGSYVTLTSFTDDETLHLRETPEQILALIGDTDLVAQVSEMKGER